MPSSKSSNSPSAWMRRARRVSTTPHLPILRGRVQQPQKQTEYISDMKKGDRVYHVLKDLRDKHRLSLKDFIMHLVTEDSTIKGSHTCAMHTKNLSSAIYQQEAVAKQLPKVSADIWTTTNSQQVSRIRSELGKVGKPEVGLGKFDPNHEVSALDIPVLAGRIQKAAPELFKLLMDLMVQQHSSSHVTSTDSQGSLVMVCSILARAYAPRTCNNFPVLLGLHLHSMEVLSSLGVSASYWEINKQSANVAENGLKLIASLAQAHRNELVVCWDNFDYNQGVRHQTLDEPSKHVSATTWKLCIGRGIPAGGLQRSMLHLDVKLTSPDI